MIDLTLAETVAGVQVVIDALTENGLRWQRPKPSDYGRADGRDCHDVFARMAGALGVDFAALVDRHHEAALLEERARAVRHLPAAMLLNQAAWQEVR